MAVMKENDFGYLHLRWYMQNEGTPGTCEQNSMQKYFVLFYRCNLFERFSFFFFLPGDGGVLLFVFLSKSTGVHVLPSDMKFLLE